MPGTRSAARESAIASAIRGARVDDDRSASVATHTHTDHAAGMGRGARALHLDENLDIRGRCVSIGISIALLAVVLVSLVAL